MKLNKLALLNGVDIFFEDQFLIHSPSLKEYSENNISEEELFKGFRWLTISPHMVDTGENIDNINNFQLFLSVMANPNITNKDKELIVKILQLILKNYDLAISPEIGIILKEKDNDKFFIINQENFELFQEYIKEIFCLNKIFPQENEYNVKSEKAKRIANTLRERHKKLAEQNKNEIGSVLASYQSILSTGLAIPLNALENYTLYQLFYSVDRYSLYYAYDLDVRCKLAGGSGDSKPENWMKIM